MNIVDTHAHLDYPDFNNDLSEVLLRAEEAGVKQIVTIATNLESSLEAIRLSEAHPKKIYAAVGVHPTEADTVDSVPEAIASLEAMIKKHSPSVIGEIGLDYHRLPTSLEESATEDEDTLYKEKQKALFSAQLEIASSLGLNVVIHQRDSWQDTIEILKPYTGKVRCVFHCFGGTLEEANLLFEMGHLISFTGIVTFKNAKQVQSTAAEVPLNFFMVETDCPYLAPTPHRGKRCEPSHTRLVAEKIAELRNIPLEELAEATSQTARDFFGVMRF